MVLIQTEPKSIKIGTTAIKRVTIRPNGTEKQIRPSGGGGWQPGANTILYAPLKTDLIDTITNTSPTVKPSSAKASISGGVAVLDYAGLYYSTGVSPAASQNRTVSFWAKMTNAAIYNGRLSRPGGWTMDMYRRSNGNIGMYWNNEGSNIWTCQLNERTLWTYTLDSGSWTLYKNGVGKAYNVDNTTSGNTAVFGFENSSDGYKGEMSELIVENVARTAQEVSDYYDLTKGNYGL